MQDLVVVSDKVEQLQREIPINDNGLPTAYVDPNDYSLVSLRFGDGYPTIDGTPFWEQLQHESDEDFDLFSCYLHLVEVTGSRSIASAARVRAVSYKEASNCARRNHWQARARAYDLYSDLAHRQQRAFAARSMTDKHLKAANRIFDICMTFLHDHQKDLTPTTALKWMDMAIKLERLSLGMSPDKVTDAVPSTVININQESGAAAVSTGRPTDRGKMQEIIQILNISGALSMKGMTADEPSESVIDVTPTEAFDTEADQVHPTRANCEANCIPFTRE